MDVEQRAGLRYMAEMGGALLLMVGAAYLRHFHLGPIADLGPIVPIWMLLWASVRYYFRLDEYQRLKYVQAAALSAGILFCLDWSYRFAQPVFGLPRQSEIVSWHFAIIFVIVSFVSTVRGKRARAA